MAGYIGKTVPTSQVKSTAEGRALLEAQSVEEQRISLDVYSQAEIDTNTYTKAEVDANTYTQAEADAKLALQPAIIPTSTMLAGDLSLTNTVKTLQFDAITYTGNGTSQSITTGMSTIDFTAASNGTGFYHDRTAGDCIVKNDAGTIVESGSIAFMDVAGVDGVCQVHVKDRDSTLEHNICDGIRGAGRLMQPQVTAVEYTNIGKISGFTSTGFTVGAATSVNTNLNKYIAYTTLYTHIKWGLTSQGKRYIEAYNPVTNDTMIMYQGSGVAGHEIPHSVGVALDFSVIKNLVGVYRWIAKTKSMLSNEYLVLSDVNAKLTDWPTTYNATSTFVSMTHIGEDNTLNSSYILYGKANSKTWGIYPYTGTGVAGNFVETLDTDGIGRRPARVIIKSVSGVGNWEVQDYLRGNFSIWLDVSIAEVNAGQTATFSLGGFTQLGNNSNVNASGVQYIALVEFDTDSTGNTGAYFDNPSATTQLQLTDGIYSVSDGFDSNGAKNKVATKSATITPVGGWL